MTTANTIRMKVTRPGRMETIHEGIARCMLTYARLHQEASLGVELPQIKWWSAEREAWVDNFAEVLSTQQRMILAMLEQGARIVEITEPRYRLVNNGDTQYLNRDDVELLAPLLMRTTPATPSHMNHTATYLWHRTELLDSVCEHEQQEEA